MATLTPNYSLIKPAVNDPTDQNLWGGYLNTSLDIIDTQMKTNADAVTAGSVPTGGIIDFAGSVEPAGYLLCFGQAVDRTTYAALFAVIGTTYGIGDGSTTFNLPDLRGRVSAGQDDMGGTSANRLTGLSGGVDGDVLGATGGAETHALVEAENGPHTHSYTTLTSSGFITGPALQANNAATGSSGTTNSSGSGNPHNNVQPTIVLNKIIKT
jgi:microcystin-dependent protein